MTQKLSKHTVAILSSVDGVLYIHMLYSYVWKVYT